MQQIVRPPIVMAALLIQIHLDVNIKTNTMYNVHYKNTRLLPFSRINICSFLLAIKFHRISKSTDLCTTFSTKWYTDCWILPSINLQVSISQSLNTKPVHCVNAIKSVTTIQHIPGYVVFIMASNSRSTFCRLRTSRSLGSKSSATNQPRK